MAATKTPTHRVVCAHHTYEAHSLEQAERHRAAVERLGECHQLHIVEVRVDGQWVPLRVVRARAALSVKLGAVVDTVDGPLTKVAGGWSKETIARADAVADVSTARRAWLAVAGPHEHAVLTADGRGADLYGWCQCRNTPDAMDAVRYERWTADGRAGHGWLCPSCRAITQTG